MQSTYPSFNPTYVQQPSAPDLQAATNISTAHIDEISAREFLSANNWPAGLQTTFLRNLIKVPIRFFICDDSGSMAINDGKKIVSDGRNSKLVSCTRWNELTAALQFHCSLAHAAGAPSEFRMLNGAAPIVVGDRERDPLGLNMQAMQTVLTGSPSGGTPLCRHIGEVSAQIRAMAPQLRANGQKAVVVIATDGESSDGDVATALRPLKDLPAWVVIRLCTDEESIVKYWNNIDNVLELDMDVLDDLTGEAEEVHEHNPWLTYGEPMHRLREFGIAVKEIDLLDETRLSPDQIRQFASFLLVLLKVNA
jgi:hypothetical protein